MARNETIKIGEVVVRTTLDKSMGDRLTTMSLMDGYEFDSYFVSNYGVVYKRTKKGEYKLAKPFMTKDGYIEYVITDVNGKQKHIQGQRIMALVFHENPNGHPHVNHKNGERWDNRIENLEWTSVSENAKHSYRVLGKRPWNKRD